MEEDDGNGSNIFKERIISSNIFSLVEIEKIKSNIELFEKCYLLGVIDAQTC
jgi:hypothetical protein